jgi:hypothetical protein
VSPSRWKGANILSLSASGTPGPQSITRSSIRPLLALAVSSGGDQECEHISGHRCEGEPQHHYRDDEPREPGEQQSPPRPGQRPSRRPDTKSHDGFPYEVLRATAITTCQRGARRRHRADDGIHHVVGAEQPS